MEKKGCKGKGQGPGTLLHEQRYQAIEVYAQKLQAAMTKLQATSCKLQAA